MKRKPAKQKRPAKFWRQLVEKYEAGTELTQKEFAEENGVPFSSFKNWLYRIRLWKREQELSPSCEQEVHFVELTVASPSSGSAQLAAVSLSLPNELFVEFGRLPPSAYLAELLTHLRRSG